MWEKLKMLKTKSKLRLMIERIIKEEDFKNKITPELKSYLKTFESDLQDFIRTKNRQTYSYAAETIKNLTQDFKTDAANKLAAYMQNKLDTTAKQINFQ